MTERVCFARRVLTCWSASVLTLAWGLSPVNVLAQSGVGAGAASASGGAAGAGGPTYHLINQLENTKAYGEAAQGTLRALANSGAGRLPDGVSLSANGSLSASSDPLEASSAAVRLTPQGVGTLAQLAKVVDVGVSEALAERRHREMMSLVQFHIIQEMRHSLLDFSNQTNLFTMTTRLLQNERYSMILSRIFGQRADNEFQLTRRYIGHVAEALRIGRLVSQRLSRSPIFSDRWDRNNIDRIRREILNGNVNGVDGLLSEGCIFIPRTPLTRIGGLAAAQDVPEVMRRILASDRQAGHRFNQVREQMQLMAKWAEIERRVCADCEGERNKQGIEEAFSSDATVVGTNNNTQVPTDRVDVEQGRRRAAAENPCNRCDEARKQLRQITDEYQRVSNEFLNHIETSTAVVATNWNNAIYLEINERAIEELAEQDAASIIDVLFQGADAPPRRRD